MVPRRGFFRRLVRFAAPLRAGAGLTAGALFSLAGCAAPNVAPPASWPPNADAALARMRASFACGRSIQASAKIDHFGDRGRVRGDALLFASRPSSVRLDIISPFGAALATLTANGARFALADLRDKRFYEGPATACNIARLTGLSVPPHVLVDLLEGQAPVLKHDPQAATMTFNPAGYYVVAIPSTRGAREEIHMAPRPEDWSLPWDRQRMRVLDVRVLQRGYLLYHAELSGHASAPMSGPRVDPDNIEPPIPPSGPFCDAEVPRKIHLEVVQPDADVRFQYQHIVWNPPLPNGTFEQAPPPGLAVETVTCD